jgi:hypothetical protein
MASLFLLQMLVNYVFVEKKQKQIGPLESFRQRSLHCAWERGFVRRK